MAGRPTKLTPQVQAAILAAIEGGNYIQVAARCAGVTDATFYNWLAWGERQGSGPYFEFFVAVKLAEAKAEAAAIRHVQAAMPESWQAAMTFLERKFPDRWRRK